MRERHLAHFSWRNKAFFNVNECKIFCSRIPNILAKNKKKENRLIVLYTVLFPRPLVWLICFVAGDSTSVEEVDVDRLSNERNACNNCILEQRS